MKHAAVDNARISYSAEFDGNPGNRRLSDGLHCRFEPNENLKMTPLAVERSALVNILQQAGLSGQARRHRIASSLRRALCVHVTRA